MTQARCPTCGQPIRTGRGGGVKALLFVAGAAVLVAAVVVIVFVAGVGRASNDLKNALVPHPGRPPGYQGATYPGMLTQDHVAGPTGVVTAVGEMVAAAHLARRPSLLGPTICADISVTNSSQENKNLGPLEWKLQDPHGTVQIVGLTGTLANGQIAPGAAAPGTVCFADVPRQSGRFLLLWQPLALAAGRGVWMFTL